MFPEGEELEGVASLDRDISKVEGVLQEADLSFLVWGYDTQIVMIPVFSCIILL